MAIRSGIHHVALRAQDMEKTIAFYTNLGCNVKRTWGEGEKQGVMLDLGGGNILEVFAGGSAEAEERPRLEHIALKSDNIDEDYAKALAAGATSQKEPTDANLGGAMPIRIAFVVGPNQEVIEFFSEL